MLDPCLPHTCYIVACLREIWLGVCNQCGWYSSFIIMCQCIPHSLQSIVYTDLKEKARAFFFTLSVVRNTMFIISTLVSVAWWT